MDETTTPKGFIAPRAVKAFAFATLSLGLVASTLLTVMAIWGWADSRDVSRSIATIIVVMFSIGVFAAINERFG